MQAQIGDRVGAIRSFTEDTVKIFGYGKYIGNEIPKSGFMAKMGAKNPKIELDNGKIIYDYQCVWGPEDRIKSIIGNRKVVIVDSDKEE